MATQHDWQKIPGIFNGFRNLESIEFKVPMVCLAIGCVSRRRDARYRVAECGSSGSMVAVGVW